MGRGEEGGSEFAVQQIRFAFLAQRLYMSFGVFLDPMTLCSHTFACVLGFELKFINPKPKTLNPEHNPKP